MVLEGVGGTPVRVELGDLLGGGSFGNAFRARCPSTAGGAPVDAVVKIYRDPFHGYLGGHKQLRTELRCLRALLTLDERPAHLPTLLAASATALVESPCGTPLPVRLRELAVATGKDSPQHRTLPAPRNKALDGALAWGVYGGILSGLRTLHKIGWLHCDVRLPNCVVLPRAKLGLSAADSLGVTDSAVLIDLGCALQLSRSRCEPESFKLPASGFTYWHDMRGALAIFVETVIGGRFSLQSSLWGKDMLDNAIIETLKPADALYVTARRDRIINHISSAHRRLKQAGVLGRSDIVAVAPIAEDYEARRP